MKKYLKCKRIPGRFCGMALRPCGGGRFERIRTRALAKSMPASNLRKCIKEAWLLKATGIVRRIDELGRVVIPKEIRRTLRIREGDPLLMSLTPWERFSYSMIRFAERRGGKIEKLM